MLNWSPHQKWRRCLKPSKIQSYTAVKTKTAYHPTNVNNSSKPPCISDPHRHPVSFLSSAGHHTPHLARQVIPVILAFQNGFLYHYQWLKWQYLSLLAQVISKQKIEQGQPSRVQLMPSLPLHHPPKSWIKKVPPSSRKGETSVTCHHQSLQGRPSRDSLPVIIYLRSGQIYIEQDISWQIKLLEYTWRNMA